MAQPILNPVNLGAVAAAAVAGLVTYGLTRSGPKSAVLAAAGGSTVFGYFHIVASGRIYSFTTLREGSTGAAVKAAQQRINMHGYGPVNVDGSFSKTTREAVQRFQKARGVAETGVVDSSTWKYLTQRPKAGTAEYSVKSLLSAMKRKGYTVYDDGRWNIVGIRSPAIGTNAFDDELHIFRKKGGSWEDHAFPITTDPGFFWLKNPMNASGTAAMVEGQYIDAYGWGMHRGAYEALVQVGDVKVYRDRDGNEKFDFDPKSIITGKYGINIHKASSDSKSVDKWSAGCQVFARERDFTKFLALLKETGQKRFTYTLFKSSEVPSSLFGGFGLPEAEHGDRIEAWTVRLQRSVAFLKRAKASGDMPTIHRAIGDVWFWVGRLTCDLLSSGETGPRAQAASRAIMEARTELV